MVASGVRTAHARLDQDRSGHEASDSQHSHVRLRHPPSLRGFHLRRRPPTRIGVASRTSMPQPKIAHLDHEQATVGNRLSAPWGWSAE